MVAINGIYKVVHGISIAAKMYDLEWPVREIQGHWFLKRRKNGEIQLISNWLQRHVEWLEALYVRRT